MKYYAFLGVMLVMLILGFGSGYVTYYKLHPIQTIEITKDINLPVYRTIYVPKTQDEWDAWAKTPIIIDRDLSEQNILTIHAHDGYKEARVTDKLNVGSTGNWKLSLGLGIGGIVAGGCLGYFIFRK